jgi:hypothetical protein
VNNELKVHEDDLNKIIEKTENDIMTDTNKGKLKDDVAKHFQALEKIASKRESIWLGI